MRIPVGEPVAVLGDGKLGLLIAQVLAANGLRVSQFGRHLSKLRIAEQAGVQTEVLRGALPVRAFDYVVDATGSADGLQQAVAMTKPRGTLIAKSTVHGAVPVDMAAIIVNEITIVGSRCGLFEPAIELLTSGRVRVDEMISDHFELADAAGAFDRAAQNGVLKVLLRAA